MYIYIYIIIYIIYIYIYIYKYIGVIEGNQIKGPFEGSLLMPFNDKAPKPEALAVFQHLAGGSLLQTSERSFEDFGSRVWGLGFRVWGLGSGFRIVAKALGLEGLQGSLMYRI